MPAIAPPDNVIDGIQNASNNGNVNDLKAFGSLAANTSFDGVAQKEASRIEGSVAPVKNLLDKVAQNDLNTQPGRIASADAILKQYKEAHRIFNDILLNQKLVDILAPTGLRNEKLTKAIGIINNSMKMLCDGINWKAVEIDDKCNILSAGIPYGRFLAKSERYRTRLLLQLMVAMAEKSRVIIVDDTDELTEDIRNQLFGVILRSQISALVVCALNDKNKLPDLSNVNGNSYWIENGKA